MAEPTKPGYKYTIGDTMGAFTLKGAKEQKRLILERFGRAHRDVKIVLNSTGEVVTVGLARQLQAEEAAEDMERATREMEDDRR